MIVSADTHSGDAAVANAIAGSSQDSAPRGLLHGVSQPSMKATDSDVKVPANFMYVRFSKTFLEQHFCTQIDRTMPVCDTILGASISGTSRTIAGSTLELVNNESQAQAKLRLLGATRFQTVAASGPARIYSKGTTTFASTEQIVPLIPGSPIDRTPSEEFLKTRYAKLPFEGQFRITDIRY